MFEQSLDDMTADVFVEHELYQTLTASNVAAISVDDLAPGSNRITSRHAVEIINRLDRCLKNCPKYLYKRIRAQRQSLVFAFGPEMEELVGPPPNNA